MFTSVNGTEQLKRELHGTSDRNPEHVGVCVCETRDQELTKCFTPDTTPIPKESRDSTHTENESARGKKKDVLFIITIHVS